MNQQANPAIVMVMMFEVGGVGAETTILCGICYTKTGRGRLRRCGFSSFADNSI
jgi:hypothetical protein